MILNYESARKQKTAENGEKKYVDAGVLPVKGLTGEEVAEKSAHGEVNGDVNIKTKSVATILRTNIFTFFNILFVIIAVIMAFFIEPDLNGFSNYEGSGNGGIHFVDDLDEGETLVVIPPEPIREGYRFQGWYRDEACTEPFDLTTYVRKDTDGILSLYAGWEQN